MKIIHVLLVIYILWHWIYRNLKLKLSVSDKIVIVSDFHKLEHALVIKKGDNLYYEVGQLFLLQSEMALPHNGTYATC